MSFVAKLVSSNGTMTCVIGSKCYSVPKNHFNYVKLYSAFKENDSDAFLEAYDVEEQFKSVEVKSGGKVKIVGETIYYNGQPLHNSMTDRMVHLLREGQDINHLVKFLENLLQNPSQQSVESAYPFLEHHGIPITEDGCFLAKKAVRSDFYDKYSGRILNRPGTVVKMERNQVVDRPSSHCAAGLHVGANSYSGVGGWYWSQGDKVLLVKVNPKNIVSCPTDHSFTKLRVCEYEVLCECEDDLKKSVYSGKGVNDVDYDEDEYDDSEYETECTFSLEPSHLRADDVITFDYQKDGVVEERCCEVTEVNSVGQYVMGTLLWPETNAGETRRFNWDKMSNVVLE